MRVRLPPTARSDTHERRLVIVIPVYRDPEVTRACIESVLAARDPERDVVVLVNDASPDEGMAELLEWFARAPGVFLLTNGENLGFRSLR